MTPTKDITKEAVEQLVDRFKGICYCYDSCSPKYKHPILKGEVEEKMLHKGVLYDESEHNGLMKFNSDILTELWQPCGFTRSLQDILSCGWDIDKKISREIWQDPPSPNEIIQTAHENQVLANPNAQALVQFLFELNL